MVITDRYDRLVRREDRKEWTKRTGELPVVENQIEKTAEQVYNETVIDAGIKWHERNVEVEKQMIALKQSLEWAENAYKETVLNARKEFVRKMKRMENNGS